MASTRLAVVSDAVAPFHAGGKETRHGEIARRLVADGFTVDVHTMRWWRGGGHYTRDGVRYRALCRLMPMYRGERRSVRQAVWFAAACVRLVGRRFDVIEADSVPVLQVIVLRLVATLRRRRLVVTWHEVWGPDYWRRYLGRLGPVAALLERWALRMPDHIVAPSHGTAERIAAVTGRRVPVTVVPNGIDLARVATARPDGIECDVLFVGRLIAHKNVDALIRAVSHLKRAVTCRIIGTGPEEGALRALAKDLRVDVRFDGRLDHGGAVLDAMRSARVFGFLSEREGFGVAPLEALACGLPVLTYDHPDNHARHLVVDGVNGRLVPALAPEPVAAALAWLLDRAGGLRAAATATARDHDWDAIAGQMSKVYRC